MYLFQSRDEDRNGDGYPDSLLLDIEVPVKDTEKIMGVKLLLFFEYRLYVSFLLPICFTVYVLL